MNRLVLPLALVLSACTTVRPGAPPEMSPPDTPPLEARELVVLVHGMGRTPLSMVPMDLALRRAGYRTLNVGYPSQGPGVEALARHLAAAVGAEVAREPAPRVHFVAHSLGGVLARWVLAHAPPAAEPGRLVLLASPVAGSAAADRWAWLLRWGLPPIAELTTGDPFDPGSLPPGVDVAVLAGDADGKVSVDEACLPGATTRVVQSGHTAIMWRPAVIRLVTAFLDTGELADAEACEAAG